MAYKCISFGVECLLQVSVIVIVKMPVIILKMKVKYAEGFVYLFLRKYTSPYNLLRIWYLIRMKA